MTEHATISPSQWPNCAKCAAFRSHGASSTASIEGSELHRCKQTGDYSGCNDEQLETLRKTDEYEAAILIEAGKVMREVKLEIALGNSHSFGTADLLTISGTTGHLLDYKTGRSEIEPSETNLQLRGYIIGAFDKFPELEEITGHLVIPRRDEATSFVFQRTQLEGYRQSIIDLFDRIYDPDPELNAGHYCNWCEKQTDCPAVLGRALSLGQKLDFVIPPNADPTTMTTEMLDQVALPLAACLDGWSKAVKKRALEAALSGEPFEDHELRHRRKPAKIIEGFDFYDRVKHLVDLDVFIALSKVSIPALRKAVASSAPYKDVTETDALQEFDQVLAEFNVNAGEKIAFLGMVSGTGRNQEKN